jgi:hypothetical protein
MSVETSTLIDIKYYDLNEFIVKFKNREILSEQHNNSVVLGNIFNLSQNDIKDFVEKSMTDVEKSALNDLKLDYEHLDDLSYDDYNKLIMFIQNLYYTPKKEI